MSVVVELREEDALAFVGVSNGDAGGYFNHARTEIAPLLPGKARRILEIGCSTGGTLRFLRRQFPQAYTVGVDGWRGARDELEQNADLAIIADLNAPVGLPGKFDLILALDILEHLENPEAVLKLLVSHLEPGGTVIVSLPAVSNIRVALRLLLKRRWTYSDQGVLDRTHRWFFEETSSVELMNAVGLAVGEGLLGGLHGRKSRLVNALTLGLFRHWLAEQYIMRGVVGEQGTVGWKIARY